MASIGAARRGFGPLAVVGLGAALALAGCGSSSHPGAAPTAPPAATASVTASASGATSAATIKRNWQAFFAGATPAARKIALLQDGSRFASVINAQASSTLAKGSGAQVSHVTLTGSSAATVRYAITLGGKPALSNQTGTAVLQSGTWKVGDASFCSLLTLEGQHLPQCTSASP